MGTWGAGIYQNDYALDLLSEEVDRLVKLMEELFSFEEQLSYDDLEGPFLYIHMLALLAQEAPIKYERLNRAIAEQWKKKVLDVFSSTMSRKDAEEEYIVERNEVMAREFDALIAGLAQYETN